MPSLKPSPDLRLQAQTKMNGGDWAGAIPLLERLLRRDGSALMWRALALARRNCGDTPGSHAAAMEAVRLAPNDVESVLIAAQADMNMHRYTEVTALLKDYANVASNQVQRMYGEALRRSGRNQEAIGPLMQALALRVDDADTYLQLAFALRSLQMLGEAAEALRTVAALRPSSLQAQAYLAHGDQEAVRWQDFDANVAALNRAIEAKPADAGDEFGVPFSLIGLPHERATLLKVARISTRFLTRGISPMPAVARAPGERLRVGYLSGDFHTHATAALLVNVLESHDRERFDVTLFSHGPDDGSPLRRRMERAGEHFIEIGDQDLAGVAARIRAERIDILVDLKGPTGESRFAALAYRPAPLQVAWLGFPGTCGADFIDYIIGDPIVTPLEHALDYSECIAQLPLCYQPNDANRELGPPVTRAELGLPEDAVVLLSANQVFKLTPQVFDVWMEILHRQPETVLWQLSGGAQVDARLRNQAQSRGIGPERLIFAPKVEMPAHARRLSLADLALDTWPCNGHTTTSDALAAGVPVVTLLGDGFASRVAASLLNAAELDVLVCADLEEYVAKACALAADAAARAECRAHLARPLPLFDGPRLALELEQLYLRMWGRAEAGLPPAHLPAA